MLDLQLLRDDPERVRQAIRDKRTGDEAVVDRLLEADRERRASLTVLQSLQQQLNEASRQIGPLMKAGRRAEAEPLLAQTNAVKAEMESVKEAARTHEEAVERLVLEIPNVPHPSVPVGATPDDNEVAHEWGDRPAFDFEPVPHWEIAAAHGLVDFERGAKVTGAGFPFYVGQGARLQRALVQFFLDRAGDAGYTEMQPPLLVNVASGIGTGQIPDKEGQMYETESADSERIDQLLEEARTLAPIISALGDDSATADRGAQQRDLNALKQLFESGLGRTLEIPHELVRLGSKQLYLVPTAEVPVTNYLRDETLDEAALPVMYAAYTPCFRREAGSYGKDVRGLNRLHQFDKVELVRFVHPDTSYEHLEALREDAERLVQALGLPYRRLLMCTADMGFTQAKKYDLEVWSAGQGRWLEVSSISNFEAFQARRANVRFRPAEGGKPQFVHTLNGSGLALPRIVAALLENYQQADGTVVVPEVLRPYTGFDRIG